MTPREQDSDNAGKKEAPRRGFLRRTARILLKCAKYFLLLLLLLLLTAAGGTWWATQTGGGHAWLAKTLNSFLEAPQDSGNLSFTITKLKGSIPADFSFSLEGRDKNGIWLQAPENRFIWNWRELPGSFHVTRIEAASINISRLPETPPADTAPEPSRPLTLEDVQKNLQDAANFLNRKHWWLPAIRLDALEASATLPGSLLPSAENNSQPLNIGATLTASFVDNKLEAGMRANLSGSHSKPLSLPSANFDSLDLNAKLTGGALDQGLNLAGSLDAFLENPKISAADLPANFLGQTSHLSIQLDARAHTGTASPNIGIAITGPNLDAGHIQLAANGSWQSDKKWLEGEISGPLDYHLKLEVQPLAQDSPSPLRLLRAPAILTFRTSGDLTAPDLELALDCMDMEQTGVSIRNTDLTLSTRQLQLPLGANMASVLENEHHFDLRLSSIIDNEPCKLSTGIFFQQLSQKHISGWRAGLRDFHLEALDAHGRGNLAALLPTGEKPLIDGHIQITAADFASFTKFLPGKKLTGSADLELNFASGLPAALVEVSKPLPSGLDMPKTSTQNARVALRIPSFSLSGSGSAIEVKSLNGDVDLQNLFGAPSVRASVKTAKISAAGLDLAADIGASGSIEGPLAATIRTTGSISSRIDARWEPGKAQVGQLEVLADLSPFLGQTGKKKKLAGLRAASPIDITYGDKGIKIGNLDLSLLPGGKLRAHGGMAPDRLDLSLSLHGLNLGEWQKLLPQLPAGSVSLEANLTGTPNRPGGKFSLGLNGIKLPNSPVPPLTLALLGNIEHGSRGSVLRTHLELDPATAKALGGSAATATASLPLLFGPDGVPTLNMDGPLQAKVRWDGALGPIWNLLPIPDRRLNGRIAVNMDAGGTMKKPQINGNAAISKARYEDLLLGVLLTDINLDLQLSDQGYPRQPKGGLDSLPGSMRLALNISDGRGGSVTANGNGSLDGRHLDIQARIDRLKPLRRRDVHIELSGQAKVTGSATAPDINGEIIVNQGEILLNNLEITSSVTTLDITDPEKEKKTANKPRPPAAASSDNGKLNVRVRMLPRFTVEGRGLTSIWKADLLIAGALTNPQVTGDISCVRGNFDFLGKIFALTKGVVFFGGGSLSNPLVDIDLTHETEDLTAHILVTGPVNKIRVKLESDPVVPRDEIISRVLFGRSVNDLSRMEMLQLAGAVAQLAGFGGGSGVLGMTKKALGVDVLRLGTADSGSENQSNADTGGGTTIEMGKYLNDYIYMGVQQGFEADSTAFILEIELTPHSNLEIRTEQDNTWAGYKWKKNY